MATEGYFQGFEIDESHSLHIYQGSLVQVRADALVSSDDNYLTAGGGVSRALAFVAGPDVRAERELIVKNHRPALGDVVRTSGGGLPCRYLYHAITIDDDQDSYMNEPVLRRLIANLIQQAGADGVRSIGLPAIGTGAARFSIGRASEIMIDELIRQLVDSPIENVILALRGSEAETLFHQNLVRSEAARRAALELRRRETPIPAVDLTETIELARDFLEVAENAFDWDLINSPIVSRLDDPVEHPEPDPEPFKAELAQAGHSIQQFPNPVDESRLATTRMGQRKLVDGLAELILKHADAEEIERELLSSPECRGFRGTVHQKLMEYLYLSEDHLRTALGPALFKNRDLRLMVKELGEDSEFPRDQDQLIVTILRALCFNTLAPPSGMGDFIKRLEGILAELRGATHPRSVIAAAVDAGKVLEQALKDLIRMYGYFFFGPDFEAELVRRKFVEARDDGGHISGLTIGAAHEALKQLNARKKRDAELKEKWIALGRTANDLIPQKIKAVHPLPDHDCNQILQEIIRARNASVHTEGKGHPLSPDEMAQKIWLLRSFFCACQEDGVYPDVLRYEGTYENKNGERFVHFLDENQRERKVRTDQKIDARRHYYCFATNNPVHLHPTLIPKHY